MRTQSLALVAMAIAGSILVLGGCGSSDEEVTAKPKAYPDTAAYCAGRAKAVCSDMFVSNCSLSKDKCVAAVQAQCGPTAGTYRADAAETCIKTITTAYADTDLTAIDQANIDRDCGRVFDGEGVVGDSCASLIDCDLDLSLECVRGKCEKPREVSVGASCEDDDAVCAKGNFCDPSASACINALGEGKTCNASKPCAEEYYCVKAAPTDADGTCQTKLADGEPCTLHSECSNGLCVATTTTGAAVCGSKSVFATGTPICEKARSN